MITEYRLLDDGEKIEAGDEWCLADGAFDSKWEEVDSDHVGLTKTQYHVPIRRKVKREPVAREHFIICSQISGSTYRASMYPFLHTTLQSAETEAIRLADTIGGKFVIFRAINAFEHPKTRTSQVPV